MERSCIQEGGDGTKFDVISLWIVFKTATEGDVHWRPRTEPTGTLNYGAGRLIGINRED